MFALLIEDHDNPVSQLAAPINVLGGARLDFGAGDLALHAIRAEDVDDLAHFIGGVLAHDGHKESRLYRA